MYKRLVDDETKSYYNRILNETIEIIDKYYVRTSEPIFKNILYQLLDIKKNVVETPVLLNSDDIDDRYTLGCIATKNFDYDKELQERLIDIFSGACDYQFLD